MREEVAYTKVCCLNDARFDAMEHLRYVPVMVLWERMENGKLFMWVSCVSTFTDYNHPSRYMNPPKPGTQHFHTGNYKTVSSIYKAL